MYCKNCGNQVSDDAAFCVKCGCNINSVSSVHTEATEVVNTFGGAIKSCLNKYATFTGRANRSEYWYWALFNFILGFIPYLGWVACLVTFIPSLAVSVRRLHDIGKSGLYYLLVLIPIVGFILMLVWFCTPSEEGENAYGPDPNC